jgi:hypothetical protein
MPLLSPSQIHQVLKKTPREPGEKKNISQLLEDNNLSPEEVLDNLSAMMRAGDNDSTRLNAAKIALQLNGLLNKDDLAQVPNVVINIIDSNFSVNPILIPR